jgi:hypothetical protein
MTTPIHPELAKRRIVQDAARELADAHNAHTKARRAHAAALAEQHERAHAAARATDERTRQRLSSKARDAVQRVTGAALDKEIASDRVRVSHDRLTAAVAEARTEVAAELAEQYRTSHECLISALVSAAEAQTLIREVSANASEVGVRLPHPTLAPPALASMLDNATPRTHGGVVVAGPIAHLVREARRLGYKVKVGTMRCERAA